MMSAVLRFRVDRPDPEARARDLFFGSFGAIFLAYSYWFPQLSTLHATLPACPFYSFTGHPCPFCGGTRSFAEMWQGNTSAALRYHPLGPVLFVLSLVVAVAVAALLATGRTVRWQRGHPPFQLVGR